MSEQHAPAAVTPPPWLKRGRNPPSQPTKEYASLTLCAAADCGYYVTFAVEGREAVTPILFAGTLQRALSFLHERIKKDDEEKRRGDELAAMQHLQSIAKPDAAVEPYT